MDRYTKVTWAYAGFAGREGSRFFEFGRVVCLEVTEVRGMFNEKCLCNVCAFHNRFFKNYYW